MRCIYVLRTDFVTDENCNIHTVYGIDAWEEDICVMSVKDIFICRNKAEKLVYLCNKFELSTIHLMDVVCDMLEDDF